MSISKVLFSFSGRIPRSTYWLAKLGILGGGMTAAFAIGAIGFLISSGTRGDGEASDSPAVMCLLLLLYVLMLWSNLAVNVKRWHDRGKSGYWEFIVLVPLIGPIWQTIELGFLEGTQGLNEFDEGRYSRDVLLAEDDPSLSAPPIAGRQCVHCQHQIASFITARLCRACSEPLHDDCSGEHLANAHRGPSPDVRVSRASAPAPARGR